MGAKQKTRAELEAQLKDKDELVGHLQAKLNSLKAELAGATQHAETLRKSLDDLKPRMHAIELENATMRGYIDRAQEDDHAREELVTVGDPDGERQLVPKRKHRLFPLHRADYGGPADGCMGDAIAVHQLRGDSRRPPKHWVTY
jgi:hypothetical protein